MEAIEETTPLTAWEELSGQQSKPAATLELRQNLEAAQAKAEPCPQFLAMQMLGKNLVLCSPSGMTQEDRTEWLKVALETIGDVPHDLLERACIEARKVCDHPAKIVPFICNETEEQTKWRKKQVGEAYAALSNANKPRLQRKPFGLPEQDRHEVATGLGELVKELKRKAMIG